MEGEDGEGEEEEKNNQGKLAFGEEREVSHRLSTASGCQPMLTRIALKLEKKQDSVSRYKFQENDIYVIVFTLKRENVYITFSLHLSLLNFTLDLV